MFSLSGGQICIIQSLVSSTYRWPSRAQIFLKKAAKQLNKSKHKLHLGNKTRYGQLQTSSSSTMISLSQKYVWKQIVLACTYTALQDDEKM